MGNAASALPYTIGKTPVVSNLHQSGWNLHEGQRKSDSQAVAVFVAKKPALYKTVLGNSTTTSGSSSTSSSHRHHHHTQYACAGHHYTYAKKLRHPNLLVVMATLDTDHPQAENSSSNSNSNTHTHTNNASSNAGGGNSSSAATNTTVSSSSQQQQQGDWIIVTEPCIPFAQWLQQETPTIDQLTWGLHNVITALSFLHNSAQVSHGNVSMDSLYVTPAGDVKLFHYSLVSSLQQQQSSTSQNGGGGVLALPRHFIDHESIVTPLAYRSPERIEQRYDAIAASGIHVMDSYSVGVLITQLFATAPGGVPTTLTKAVQRLQTPNLKMRPKLLPLLKCPIFDTPYQHWQMAVTTEFPVRTIEQKIATWTDTIAPLVPQLPMRVVLYKLLPLMQQEITTICENESLKSQELYRKEVLVMLTPFFYIAETILDRATLNTQGIGKVIGILYKINDRAIRGTLLQKANFMADHFDKVTLNDAVFEPMCGGFSDSSAALRELTLKATASLVPHLSHPNLEKLSRYLVRLQSDPESSIRTNTVIFFSKLAPHLTEVTRQKILLPAFVRAMKDPFTPCRLAALRSTVKAKTFFDPMGIASRVLPAITPQLLDPSGEVRREAFMAVDDLLFVLRQESERLSTLPEQTMTNPNIPSSAPASTTTTATNGTAPQHSHPPLPPGPQAPNHGMGRPAPSVPAAPAPSSGGFSLGGISSWMTSSGSSSNNNNTNIKPTAAAPVPNTPMGAVPSTMPVSQPPTTHSTNFGYTVPTPAMHQMNLNSNTTTTTAASNIQDDWDDDGDDDGGWGDDDDDDLDVSIPKSSSLPPQQQQQHPKPSQPNMGRLAPAAVASTNPSTTSAASLFKGNMDEDDDFFGGFDNKPAKPMIRPMTGGTGKLVVPVKKPLAGKLSTTPKPVIKKLTTNNGNNNTSANNDDGSDNWDDF